MLNEYFILFCHKSTILSDVPVQVSDLSATRSGSFLKTGHAELIFGLAVQVSLTLMTIFLTIMFSPHFTPGQWASPGNKIKNLPGAATRK